MDPSEWSLINYLEWRSKFTDFSNKTTEHSVFKNLVQKIADNDDDQSKRVAARRILDNWTKESVEISQFWKEWQERAKNIMKMESLDWNYLCERDNELNKHLGVIRGKRRKLLGEDQKVPVRDVYVNIDNKNLSGDSYEAPETTDQISSGSLNSSGSSYQPHTSSDDDETIADKSKKFDYLTGPGKIEFGLNRDSIKWMVDDLDISSICELFRNNAIEKSQHQVLSVHEELALSHIFLIEEENNAGLKEYLDANRWTKINDQARVEYPFAKLNDSIYEIWTNVSKITCKQQNHLKLKKEVKSFLRQYTCNNELDQSIIEVYENLINKFQTLFVNEGRIEDTHVHKYIAPVVDPFFQEGKINIDWSNRMSSSSTTAKRTFDPCLFGNKPDFIFKTTNQKKFIEILIGEVKPPKSSKSLIENDTVTIGKIMKSSLDLSIEYGIEDISVYGLQFAGYDGKFYGMDLNYDGICRMMLLGQFQVPYSPESFGSLINCFQILVTAQNLVYKSVEIFEKGIMNNLTKKNNKPKKKGMTRKMFHSPMKLI